MARPLCWFCAERIARRCPSCLRLLKHRAQVLVPGVAARYKPVVLALRLLRDRPDAVAIDASLVIVVRSGNKQHAGDARVVADRRQGRRRPFVAASVVLFGIGRVRFLRVYPKGAGGRAIGMSVTALPSAAAFLISIVLIALRL